MFDASAAFAEGDIHSRLFDMRQMDRNKDGMVSKDEFLAMVAKLWDMQAAEKKAKGGMRDANQIKELEKLLAAAAIALLAGSSFNALAAEDNSPKTRSQVLAELEQARADGSFYAAGDGTPLGLARARAAFFDVSASRRRNVPAAAVNAATATAGRRASGNRWS